MTRARIWRSLARATWAGFTPDLLARDEPTSTWWASSIRVADALATTVAADCRTTAFADHRDLLGARRRRRDRHAHAASPWRGPRLLAPRRSPAGRKAAGRRRWPRPTTWCEPRAVHGVVLQVGHVERFNPAFTAAAAASAIAEVHRSGARQRVHRSARPTSASCST